MSWVPPPFNRMIGLSLESAEGGVSVTRLAGPNLTNPRGEVHGGAIATLLDSAVSQAACSLGPEGCSVATISLNIVYLNPGQGVLTGHGRVLRFGRTLTTAEAEARDESGQLVAKATGSLRMIVPKTPAGR